MSEVPLYCDAVHAVHAVPGQPSPLSPVHVLGVESETTADALS